MESPIFLLVIITVAREAKGRRGPGLKKHSNFGYCRDIG